MKVRVVEDDPIDTLGSITRYAIYLVSDPHLIVCTTGKICQQHPMQSP